MSLIFYVIINDIDDFVWCTNGFAIFVQCFVQYSIESFDKFVINFFELHPKTSAQLVGKLFNPYIFLNIDELDFVPNSSTSNSILNPNCNSFCFEPHPIVSDCNVHVIFSTIGFVIHFNIETSRYEAKPHPIISNCSVHFFFSHRVSLFI